VGRIHGTSYEDMHTRSNGQRDTRVNAKTKIHSLEETAKREIAALEAIQQSLQRVLFTGRADSSLAPQP
jgi:hypothetical protein